ncbi:MAG: ankyrin repeat domain-containing protein [Chloroflexota bacterium]
MQVIHNSAFSVAPIIFALLLEFANIPIPFEQVGKGNAANIINSRDHRGFTTLHKAMESGNTQVAQLLIDYGADVQAVVTGEDPHGWNAVHLAAFFNFPELIRLLAGCGADINCARLN